MLPLETRIHEVISHQEANIGRKFIHGHNRKNILMSEEQKKNIGNSNRHKIRSEQTIKNLSKSHKGQTSLMKGRHHTIDSINKMCKSHKNISQETRKKISENHADVSGENGGNWKGGISFLPYCPKFNFKKKEEVREKYNRKCYYCNKDEKDNITKTGKFRRLDVHHIDSDKEQGCNGKPWKLLPACMSCHVIERKTLNSMKDII